MNVSKMKWLDISEEMLVYSYFTPLINGFYVSASFIQNFPGNYLLDANFLSNRRFPD
jgi:hypothetical protein